LARGVERRRDRRGSGGLVGGDVHGEGAIAADARRAVAGPDPLDEVAVLAARAGHDLRPGDDLAPLPGEAVALGLAGERGRLPRIELADAAGGDRAGVLVLGGYRPADGLAGRRAGDLARARGVGALLAVGGRCSWEAGGGVRGVGVGHRGIDRPAE